MHNISKLVQENKQEAIEIIKKNGGSISFVGDVAPDKWIGNLNEVKLPFVIISDLPIFDCAVLAVRLTESGEIEFYGLDVDIYEASMWREVSECANNTENEIYEYIGNKFND